MTEQSSNLENFILQSRLELDYSGSTNDRHKIFIGWHKFLRITDVRFSEVFAFNNAFKLFSSRLSSLILSMMINNTCKQGSVVVTRIT